MLIQNVFFVVHQKMATIKLSQSIYNWTLGTLQSLRSTGPSVRISAAGSIKLEVNMTFSNVNTKNEYEVAFGTQVTAYKVTHNNYMIFFISKLGYYGQYDMQDRQIVRCYAWRPYIYPYCGRGRGFGQLSPLLYTGWKIC
jgi:hypothetical protein